MAKKVYGFTFQSIYYAENLEDAVNEFSADLPDLMLTTLGDPGNWTLDYHPNRGHWAWAYKSFEHMEEHHGEQGKD